MSVCRSITSENALKFIVGKNQNRQRQYYSWKILNTYFRNCISYIQCIDDLEIKSVNAKNVEYWMVPNYDLIQKNGGASIWKYFTNRRSIKNMLHIKYIEKEEERE